MKLTEAMKAWLVEHANVKADATDDEFRMALGAKLASGDLSMEKYAELAAEPEEDDEVKSFGTKLDALTDAVGKLVEVGVKGSTATKDPPTGDNEGGETGEKGNTTPPSDPGGSNVPPEWHKSMHELTGSSVPTDESGQPRVKGAWEEYRTEKGANLTFPEMHKGGERRHQMAGEQVRDFHDHGKGLIIPSDREKAVAGAYAKFLCATAQRLGSRNMGFNALPQHDKELLYWGMKNLPWGGASDGGDLADIKGVPLNSKWQKALIDDATSGGLEAAPIVFDDMVIQTPLLHGELFPLTRLVPLDRGRRIEGVVTGTVTGGWGGVDDSAISLFNTNSYVSAFDTTIYRWEGAIRVGLDFLSDTPIDFAAHITEQYGERMLEDLDDVVAVGNGTTQPEGVMNKSGTTSVAFGGSNSISNIESLRFGVAKAEHRSTVAQTAVFAGTETTYQRWRGLPVGASDARRLFGNDHFGPNGGGYMISNGKFAVNESLANTQAFYCILGRYRMYRRRGLVMRTSTEGDTLIRNNEMLMVAMMRYGGQLERGAVAAVSTTLPS